MSHNIHRDEAATRAIAAWADATQAQAPDPFSAARQVVRRLGATVEADETVTFGFWLPDAADRGIAPGDIRLELLLPPADLDLTAADTTHNFERLLLPLTPGGDYLWAVVDGLPVGSRDQVGAFYWLRNTGDNAWTTRTDPLAWSVPYGTKAPSEVYDIQRMQRERPDRAHYHNNLITVPDADGVPRIQAPVNILQIHPGTATEDRSLAGLARVYRRIAQKLRAGQDLSPTEQHFSGYDAVELMPIEPTIEYEAGPLLWEPVEDDGTSQVLRTRLRRPSMTNWGYDVMLAASPAVNPVILETARPDELIDLIAALHAMPGKPIMFMVDIVYGHTDNQALPVLAPQIMAGPNMYGQSLDYQNPVTRALLLEMQRRKNDFGVDGVRVDGAQDFKYWDADQGEMIYDDAFLTAMNDVEQQVDGVIYRPWMIFEDGRPWPRDDWELASSYREVTKQHDNVWQWGPLTFAHNTPFLYTFWISKWWRIREIAAFGDRWITGCANHDTLRRGTQVAIDARVNTYLGETLYDIFQNAYDNAAYKLFDYAIMPGIPMDFVNASLRAPWAFIRNTDDRYAIKVVSEESRFTYWAMNETVFAEADVFTRLKALGFTSLDVLRRFMRALDHAVQSTDDTLDGIAAVLNAHQPDFDSLTFDVPGLKAVARAWMDDVYDYCNVARYIDGQDPDRARYNRSVREFRRARPWLMERIGTGDTFDYLYPTEGSVVFYGQRTAPDGGEQVMFAANMEGAPRDVRLADLPLDAFNANRWQIALVTPGLTLPTQFDPASDVITLENCQGLVLTRTP